VLGKRAVPCIAGPKARGERVWLKCLVIDGDGVPVNDAMIEIWQADAEGKYNHPDDPQQTGCDPECRGFGRMGTGEDGSCVFETVKPGRVLGAGGRLQAPHLSVAVFARGMLKQQYTRIYFAGDPANDEDAVLALVPPDRRETLLAHPDPQNAGHWKFEIHLQGARETVFFDI
jgi:protocatechuate 3,4-dioxygenase, alpha subunit